MRVLVVADIHGNRRGPGSDPGAVRRVRLRRRPGGLRARTRPVRRVGSRERPLLRSRQPRPRRGPGRGRFRRGRVPLPHLRHAPAVGRRLTADQRRYLADLPTSRMFVIGGKPFLLVHATPRDPMDEYAPPDPLLGAANRGPARRLRPRGPHAPALHTAGRTARSIVNPGSVGLAATATPAPPTRSSRATRLS